MPLKDKTLFITGGSRGIGLAIALAAARGGANVAVAAKTQAPHPKLPGTIHTAAAEIEAAGGRALALAVDVREEAAVKDVMRRSRRPEILADAACRIFEKPAASFSGHFLIDDTFLAAEGTADFEPYRVDPGEPLAPDFFVPDAIAPPPGVTVGTR